jgi:tetratricopeptide (TPR) repeat protein
MNHFKSGHWKLSMKLVLLFIALLLAPLSGFCTNADSLERLLDKATGEEKFNLLIQLVRQHSRSDLTKSLYYAEQAYSFAEESTNDEWMANALNSLAIIYFNRGDNHQALAHLKQYLEQINKLYNKNPGSEQYLNKLLKGYNNIGNVMKDLGEFNQAMESFLKARAIMDSLPAEKLNLPLYIKLLNNTGTVKIALGDYDKANEILKTALALSRKNADDLNISISLNNLGLAAIETKRFDEALEYFNEAVEIGKKINDLMALGGYYNNIGLIFERQQQFEKSLEFYNKSLGISRKLAYHYGIANTLGNIANIEIQTSNYHSAGERLKEALHIAKITGIKNLVKKIYLYQYDLYHHQNKFEEALNAHIFYTQIKDSLFNEQRSRQIAEMEARYESEKQQRKNEILKKDIEIRKNHQRIFLIAIAALVLVAFLLFVLFRTKARSLKNEKIIRQLEKEKNEMETKRLEDQLFAEQEINKLQSEKLEQKNRELSTRILHSINKNDAMTSIIRELQEVKSEGSQDIAQCYEKINRIVKDNINLDKDWDQFKLHFEEVNPGFFYHLDKQFPGLTQNEQKLCAYYRINLDTKEIARILNVTNAAIQKSRHRLRKKMNIPSEVDLNEFMSRF